MLIHLTFYLLLQFSYSTQTLEPIVTTNSGSLKGSILKDIDGNEFYSFQTIPYAKPPIGKLRFKDPQPIEKWTGIRDATKESPMCLQNIWALKKYAGNEDCLFLNVYTPDISPKELKAVLVFIHGGGFIEGSGNYSTYGPEFLMSQDVILVTLNYRLGILGFTNFADPDLNVPGNAGLKDQNMALKWIRDNINFFGGDPNKITISGESAGGASVHLHMLSPLSQGLFQRAILQSGTAIGAWLNGEVNNGVNIATFLGFSGNNGKEMVEFLQNVSYDELYKASKNASILIPIDEPNKFGPIVENSSHAFLPDTPRNIIKSGNFTKVPFMIGMTNAEAIVIDVLYIWRDNTYTPLPTKRGIPFKLNFNGSQFSELVKKFENFYKSSDESRPAHLDLLSDAYFTYPLYETVFAHLNLKQDVYVYLFSSESKLNWLKLSTNITSNYKGASHIDDLSYLFTHLMTPKSSFKNDTIEYKSIKNTVGLFCNFVKHNTMKIGENKYWSVANGDSISYVNIDLDKNIIGVDFYKKRASFWCDIHRELKQECFCPPNYTLLL